MSQEKFESLGKKVLANVASKEEIMMFLQALNERVRDAIKEEAD